MMIGNYFTFDFAGNVPDLSRTRMDGLFQGFKKKIGFLVSKETVVLRGWERSRPLSLKTDKPLFIH